MKKEILIIFFLLITCFSYSQDNIKILVLEKNSNKPLGYTNIVNIQQRKGTITDENGICKLRIIKKTDIIQFSFIGYKTKTISIQELIVQPTIWLEQNVFNINLVTIKAFKNEKEILGYLFKVIKANKKQSEYFKAKACLIAESYTTDLPLERQESIGNIYLNSFNIDKFIIKNGRFGQNSLFNFFTTSPSSLINRFNIFNASSYDDFPNLITSLPKNTAKQLFKLKYTAIDSQLESIQFTSVTKKDFSGEIIFNKNNLKIYKIILSINNPNDFPLQPINKMHEVKIEKVRFTQMMLNNSNKISFVKVDYDFTYTYEIKKHQIKTHILLFINDYNNLYTEPSITNIDLPITEYQQIILNSYNKEFWSRNFPFIESKSVEETYKYFKRNGYVSDFKNHIENSRYLFLNINTRKWDSRRIVFEDLAYESKKYNFNKRTSINGVPLNYKDDFYKISVGYYLNYINNQSDSTGGFITYSILDKRNTYYFLEKSIFTLIAINIYFDIYEENRKELNKQLKNLSNIDKANLLVKQYSIKSKKEADAFFENSEKGEDVEMLIKYNERIFKALKTDNILEFSNFEIKKKSSKYKPEIIIDYYNLGTVYFYLKQYKNSVKYLSISLEDESQTNAQVINSLFNRGLSYLKLSDKESACKDFKNAMNLNDKESKKMYNENCNE